MKLTNGHKALIEQYLLATVTAGIAIYQGGNHDFKKVIWSAVIGVFGPIIAKINPKSAVNKLAAAEKVNNLI
jgi:hypothetical protein